MQVERGLRAHTRVYMHVYVQWNILPAFSNTLISNLLAYSYLSE